MIKWAKLEACLWWVWYGVWVVSWGHGRGDYGIWVSSGASSGASSRRGAVRKWPHITWGGGSECEICNSQGYSFAGIQTEEWTGGECLPVCQWQTANLKDAFVCLPTGIDSVDIKFVIYGHINAVKSSRPFCPRAGDVIHPDPMLWLVKGRVIARLIQRVPQ